MTGKEKCRELRQIRRQIAEQNNIDLPLEDCTYEGPCEGTCPKCEEELRSLEAALTERKKAGLDVKLKGIASDAAEKWSAREKENIQPEQLNTPGKTLKTIINRFLPGRKNPPAADPPARVDDDRIPRLAGVPARGDRDIIPQTAGVGAPRKQSWLVKLEYRASDGRYEEIQLYSYNGQDYIIGTAEDCTYTVRLPDFSAKQLRLFYDAGSDTLFVENLDCNTVYINGEVLFGRKILGWEKAEISVEDSKLNITRLQIPAGISGRSQVRAGATPRRG